MYEYIKGKKIELEEHMLSSSEVAAIYGLFTQESKNPHGLMVSAILRQYIIKNNLNIAEYYYPHSKGCMRVYPNTVWKPALDKFIYDNDLDINQSHQKRVYKVDSENKKFVFIHKQMSQAKINTQVIDINERRQRNGN